MNKIIIRDNILPHDHVNGFVFSFQQANRILPILRSDFFSQIIISSLIELNPKDMKFLIHLVRLLKSDGQVYLQTPNNQMIGKILKSLKMFEGRMDKNSHIYTKTQHNLEQQALVQKLSIGFYSVEEQQKIDENELLQGQNLQIQKKAIEKCDTKPRACANCNCGRNKKQQISIISKQELIDSINVGKPIAGCGKCYLGDSFRCSTCPYNGLPSFKPGDKLKLIQTGGVIVEEAATYINFSGKIKLQI